MDPFSLSTGIAGLISLGMELTRILQGYISDYKSAPEDAHNLLVEVTSLCHVLKQFVEFLRKDFKGRLEPTSALVALIRTCQEEVEGLYKKLEKLKGGGNKVKELVDRLKWPLKKEEFESTVTTLHRFMQTFQFSLSVANCEILSKSTDDVMALLEEKQEKLNVTISVLQDQMEESMAGIVKGYKKQNMMLGCVMEALVFNSKTQSKILNSVEELHDKFDAREMEDLLKWISPLEPQIRHQDIRSKRFGNTGTWFLELEEFQKWRNDDAGTDVFGVYGIPGAGKTVMSSLVVDHLSSRYSGQNVCVACLHCDYQDTENQSLVNMVGGILKQALCSARNLSNTVVQPLITKKKARKKLELEDALKALTQVLQSFDTAFICIDALDECEEECRWSLLESLQQLAGNSGSSLPSRIKFFFTGRPEMEEYVKTHTSFEELSPTAVTLKANSQDIVEFLNHKMSKDKRVKMTQEFKDHIVSEIVSKSRGMFLLPVLQISTVLEKTTVKRRREALKTMPHALNDAFRLTMERVKNQTSDIAEQALNVLKWIFLAERPLTLEELRHALSIEPELEELDEEDFIDAKSIFEGCFGLVIMDEATSTLRLVHKSLQDYLDSQYEEGKLFRKGHGEIALACLTYISFDIPDFMDLVSCNKLFEAYVLLEYAIRNWGHHARKERGENTPNQILTLLNEKSDSNPYFQWLLSFHIWRTCGNDTVVIDMTTTADMVESYCESNPQNLSLVVATYFGAESVVRGLVNCQDIDINAKGGGERVAMSWAAERGYTTIAELLFQRDNMDIDSKEIIGRTPLTIAAEAGHSEIARLLIERNANVNSKDNFNQAPIDLATQEGHTEIVRLLLNAGAIFDEKAGFASQTPLSIAAEKGHIDILELLLRKDVDINAKDKYGATALGYAAAGRHVEIARMLLERDIDLNSTDGRGRTPLCWAAERGRVDILDLFLKRGFAVDAQDPRGRTPLSYVAGVVYRDTRWHKGLMVYKHREVMEFLLNHGAEVDVRDKKDRTPLSWAAEAGHSTALSILLERDADVNSQDQQGRSPLMWSVMTDAPQYDDDVLRLILEQKDVDVGLVDKDYGMTALEWAEELGNEEAEEILRAHCEK